MERVTAYFCGFVQGVGFRFTAVAVARRHPGISGYVRNMRDGRVELVAEGPAEGLGAFIREIKREMGSYVEDVTTERSAASGEFSGFGIKY